MSETQKPNDPEQNAKPDSELGDTKGKGESSDMPSIENAAAQENLQPATTPSAVPSEGKPSQPGSQTQAHAQPEAKKSWVAGLALLIALLVMITLIGAALLINDHWPQWQAANQERGERIAALSKQVEALAESNNRQDLEVLALRTSQDGMASREQMANFQARAQNEQKQYQDAVDGSLAELTRLVKGGRVTWQLGEVEHLLLVANDRVLLAADAEGAIQALKLANQRLAAINDPRFLRVRNKVVSEITALKAVAQPDTINMVLTLSSIVRTVPQLPIPSDVPPSYQPDEAIRPEVSQARENWERVKQAMKSTLHDYIVIRRKDEPLEPLMAPDQSFFLRQNLVLKLETARLALLQEDSQTFRDSVTLAREWLARWFDLKQPAVSSARNQLQELERAQIEVALPDISQSLALFRERLADIEMAAGK